MSRITKQIAEAVANQLVLPKRQEVKEQELKLNTLATEIYKKTIPTEVLHVYEKHPNYFRKRGSFQLNTNGFNYEHFNLIGYLPENYGGGYPNISTEDAPILRAQKDKVTEMVAALEKLKLDIKTAIFNLRTYKNVEKEFPEAFKLLPTKQTTALIVNLKDIRCKLDKANC